MKIRVSYSELVSGPGFNNRKAEAEIEIEVPMDKNLPGVYDRAFALVKREVRKQLDAKSDDDLPF